jgi:kynurenine formamidase
MMIRRKAPGWILAAALLMATGCGRVADAPPEVASESGGGFDLAGAEIVDLSHAYGEDTLYWPTSPSKFELEVLAHGVTDAGFFYSANSLSTPEHGGTHLDAPIHFAEGRWAADEIPLERLIGPAVVIDVSAQAAADSDYRLGGEDLFSWEAEYGLVPEGAIVLLRTDWSERWPDALAYLGDDTPGDASNLHFPAYGEEAARTLVEERQVAVLGVDTASIDHGPSTDFVVHQVANGANVAGLENLTNLDRLPATGAWVVALPMKIAGGSGGPARIVALLPPAEPPG